MAGPHTTLTSAGQWQKPNDTNPVRCVPSGIYFARFELVGKLVRKSRRPDVVTVTNPGRRMLKELKGSAPNRRPTRRSANQILGNRAASLVGIPRFTHHDLRHWSTTRCIESSRDIPKVSRWLGHGERGALAMKNDGPHWNEHSRPQAQTLKF